MYQHLFNCMYCGLDAPNPLWIRSLRLRLQFKCLKYYIFYDMNRKYVDRKKKQRKKRRKEKKGENSWNSLILNANQFEMNKCAHLVWIMLHFIFRNYLKNENQKKIHDFKSNSKALMKNYAWEKGGKLTESFDFVCNGYPAGNTLEKNILTLIYYVQIRVNCYFFPWFLTF